MITFYDGVTYQGRLHLTGTLTPWNGSIELRGGIIGADCVHAMKAPVLVKQPLQSDVEPFMSLSSSTAQALMDELWRCGLRPTEGSGSAGSLAATERHLADMRALAAHALNAKLP